MLLGATATQSTSRYEKHNFTVPVATHVVAPPVKQVSLEQISCLAMNIFHEASGEPFAGQAAVARVVVNRIAHGFAKTPCGVVYQANVVNKTEPDSDETVQVKVCQFSWVCEGKGTPNKNSERYKQAEQIAKAVLEKDAYSDVVPRSTLFFHNLTVSPQWAYKRVASIGNHLFYSKEKRAS